MGFTQIPSETISREALLGLIEEFVSRDGTDYGLEERTLEKKRDAVASQLKRGDVAIVFDTETETCNIILKEQLDQS
jgi:uncharacterized protein YheU (UPF0270 family)